MHRNRSTGPTTVVRPATEAGHRDRQIAPVRSEDLELMRQWLHRFVGSRSLEALAGGRVILDFPTNTPRGKSTTSRSLLPAISLFSPWIRRRPTSKARLAAALKGIAPVAVRS